MKIRFGFVSNSSTSSFVCDVCGETFSGRDAGLEETEMFQCINGHTVCVDEAFEDFSPWIESVDNEFEAAYEVPEKYCPICQMAIFSASDLAGYLLRRTEIPRDEAFAEVKKANKRRKKLYDNEYVMYACSKFEIPMEKLTEDIKSTYPTYREFKNYILGREK